MRLNVTILWFVLSLLFVTPKVYSQNPLLDSLQTASSKDSIRILNKLLVQSREKGKFKASLDYGILILNIHRQDDDKKGMANALNNIGVTHFYMGSYTDALGFLLETLELYRSLGDKTYIAKGLNNVGLAYFELGESEKAKKYFHEALELKTELGQPKEMATTINNLGLVEIKEKRYGEALRYFSQSLEIFEKVEGPWEQANVYNNIARTYIAMSIPNEALKALEKALAIADSIDAKSILRYTHKLYCDTYIAKNNFKKALEHKTIEHEIDAELLKEKHSKDLLKSKSNLDSEIQAYKFQLQSAELKKQKFLRYSAMVGFLLIGFICFLLYRIILVKKSTEVSLMENIRSLKKSESAREKSLAFEEMLSKVSKGFIHVTSAELNSEIRNVLQISGQHFQVDRCALFQFNKDRTVLVCRHIWCRNGVDFNPIAEVLSAIEVPWFFQQQLEGNIVKISQIDDIPTGAIPDKKFFKSLDIKSTVSVPLFYDGEPQGFISFDSVFNPWDWKDDLIQRMGLLSEVFSYAFGRKEADSHLRMAMIEGQEQERNRIAEDLHDGIGPMLSTLRLNLEEYANSNKEKQNFVFQSGQLIDQTISEIRSISHNLSPVRVRVQGLEAAITHHCNQVTGPNTPHIQFRSFHLENRLPYIIEVSLFRMVQELLNNALKHAEAKNINIQLVNHESEIVLMVEDDGSGFEFNPEYHSGIGLNNIINRVNSLNGNCYIDSTMNKGTSITIEVPK